MTIRSFRDLTVWQRGIDLSVTIYELTEDFPKHELYGLVSQMRRAATSVPANIAEGRGRSSTKDFRRYLSIAIGSLAELETFIIIGVRLGHVSQPTSNNMIGEIGELTKMIHALRRSLLRRLRKPPTPNP